MATTRRVLIVASSHEKVPDGPVTGVWAEELAAPLFKFKDSGYEVTIASVKGGAIHLSPQSLTGANKTEHVARLLGNAPVLSALTTTPSVKDILEDTTASYDAIFIPGGHGVMFDAPNDPATIALIEKFDREGKVVSSVCHGPASFVNCKKTDGEPLVKGRKLTAFSNPEEEEVKETCPPEYLPFWLETRLKELGAIYSKAEKWAPRIVVDGHLITGQNPASSAPIAEEVIKAIGK